MHAKIQSILKSSIDTKAAILNDTVLLQKITSVAQLIITAFNNDKKILFCGNGGSAADAQHLSAEFTGRFYTDRHPLPSEALHCNSSYLTAVANDYGYEFVFSRLLQGVGCAGDVLIGLSTSGNSPNIIKAMQKAKEMQIHTIAFTGSSGGSMANFADFLINIPSTDTPRIQECHITIGHIICQLVEEHLFTK